MYACNLFKGVIELTLPFLFMFSPFCGCKFFTKCQEIKGTFEEGFIWKILVVFCFLFFKGGKEVLHDFNEGGVSLGGKYLAK